MQEGIQDFILLIMCYTCVLYMLKEALFWLQIISFKKLKAIAARTAKNLNKNFTKI